MNNLKIVKLEAIKQPLNYQRIKMLKLFSNEMVEEDYLQIKQLVVKLLSRKLDILAHELWGEKDWTNENMRTLLNEHPL